MSDAATHDPFFLSLSLQRQSKTNKGGGVWGHTNGMWPDGIAEDEKGRAFAPLPGREGVWISEEGTARRRRFNPWSRDEEEKSNEQTEQKIHDGDDDNHHQERWCEEEDCHPTGRWEWGEEMLPSLDDRSGRQLVFRYPLRTAIALAWIPRSTYVSPLPNVKKKDEGGDEIASNLKWEDEDEDKDENEKDDDEEKDDDDDDVAFFWVGTGDKKMFSLSRRKETVTGDGTETKGTVAMGKRMFPFSEAGIVEMDRLVTLLFPSCPNRTRPRTESVTGSAARDVLRGGREISHVAAERKIRESTLWSYLLSAANSFSTEDDFLAAKKLVPPRVWDSLLCDENMDDRLSLLLERTDTRLGSTWRRTPHRGSILCFARASLRSLAESSLVRPAVF